MWREVPVTACLVVLLLGAGPVVYGGRVAGFLTTVGTALASAAWFVFTGERPRGAVSRDRRSPPSRREELLTRSLLALWLLGSLGLLGWQAACGHLVAAPVTSCLVAAFGPGLLLVAPIAVGWCVLRFTWHVVTGEFFEQLEPW